MQTDFMWTLAFAPFVSAWLWQLGGADFPEQVDVLENKLWRRIGDPALIVFNGLAAGIGWGACAISGMALFVGASMGYGKLITRKDYMGLMLIGALYSTPAFCLTIAAKAWYWLPITPLPAVAWLAVVYASNHKDGWKLPWKPAEGIVGLSIFAACVPAYLTAYFA